MKKRPTHKGTKKETQKYYNYEIKEYLVKNYRKLKTRTGPQRK